MNTVVSDGDYEELSKYKWLAAYKNKAGKPYFYAARNIYPNGREKPIMVYMHREIAKGSNGKTTAIDHINGLTLDNRRDNLRIATRAQNLANKINTKGVQK